MASDEIRDGVSPGFARVAASQAFRSVIDSFVLSVCGVSFWSFTSTY